MMVATAIDCKLPCSNSLAKSKSFSEAPVKAPLHLMSSIESYALREPSTMARKIHCTDWLKPWSRCPLLSYDAASLID